MGSSDSRENEERGRAIVQTLAVVVESMLHPAEAIPTAYEVRTKFEAFRAPGISVRDYLMRILKYSSCSPECFVLALVYIDRLHQMQGVKLTELNVHRVLITSVVLAAKFFDDHYFNNAYYAKVGGVPCSEMNELEVEFLLMVNFSLHVTTDTYVRYYNELSSHYVFTSGRSPVALGYTQFRHYVTMDPQQEGQLIYVTERFQEEPPRYQHNEYNLHQSTQPIYAYQPNASINAYSHSQTSYYPQQQTYPYYQQQYNTQPAYGCHTGNHYSPRNTTHEVDAETQASSQSGVARVSAKHQTHHSRNASHEGEADVHTTSESDASGVNGKYHKHQSESAIYEEEVEHRAQAAVAVANSKHYNHNHYSHRSAIYEDEANHRAHSSVTMMNTKHHVTTTAAGPSTGRTGIVYASTSRTSGQKRRQSAVALDVNA